MEVYVEVGQGHLWWNNPLCGSPLRHRNYALGKPAG